MVKFSLTIEANSSYLNALSRRTSYFLYIMP